MQMVRQVRIDKQEQVNLMLTTMIICMWDICILVEMPMDLELLLQLKQPMIIFILVTYLAIPLI